MKKFTSVVLVLIIAMLFSVSSFANFFNVMIDDSASLFTEEEIELIDASAYEFALEKNFSVAVVTTDDAMGKSAMEYADDYYDSLIFGSGWSEDGILFLIDMDNREIYVSCAGLCIDEYSDYELDSIIDRGYDCIVNEEYCRFTNKFIRVLLEKFFILCEQIMLPHMEGQPAGTVRPDSPKTVGWGSKAVNITQMVYHTTPGAVSHFGGVLAGLQ